MAEKSPKDRKVDPSAWLSRIDAYNRAFSTWKRRSREIIDRFRLKSESGQSRLSYEDSGSFNVLWANVMVLKPALFSRTPQIIAERRNRDSDTVGRLASMVLERAANAEIETNCLADSMESVVLDVLLCGRGVPWLLFDADPLPPEPVHQIPPPPPPPPQIGPDGVPMPVESPPEMPPQWATSDGEPVDPAEIVDVGGVPMVKRDGVTNERTTVDYVKWDDLAHSPSRSWKEVERDGWVARRVAMSRSEGMKRFGEKFSKVEMTLSSRLDNGDLETNTRNTMSVAGDEPRFAEVWEIWDASTRRRIHIVSGFDDALEVEDDPYGLEKFFPCPMPAYETLTNEDLVPISDYEQYRGMANELDVITKRIRTVVKTMKLRGIYDESFEGVGEMLTGDEDGVLTPVKGGAALNGHGGLENIIQWAPIEVMSSLLQNLQDARDRTQHALYEISGVSDIFRGQVDPREKASQSKIKAQYASQRLDQKRRVIERCARDVSRIMVEVMAELFSPETLREQSGFDLFPEVQQLASDQQAGPAAVEQLWDQVVQLIRDDRTRGFRIEIETDSTIALDSEIEGESRNQFMAAMSGFLTNVLPAIKEMPEIMPAIGQLMLFTIKGHRAGRQLESSFERAADQLAERLKAQKQAEQQQGPPPDPVAEAEAARIQQRMQIEGAKGEADLQRSQMEAQAAQQQAQMAQAAAEQEAAASETKGKLDVLAKLQGMQMKQEASDQTKKERG